MIIIQIKRSLAKSFMNKILGKILYYRRAYT